MMALKRRSIIARDSFVGAGLATRLGGGRRDLREEGGLDHHLGIEGGVERPGVDSVATGAGAGADKEEAGEGEKISLIEGMMAGGEGGDGGDGGDGWFDGEDGVGASVTVAGVTSFNATPCCSFFRFSASSFNFCLIYLTASNVGPL